MEKLGLIQKIILSYYEKIKFRKLDPVDFSSFANNIKKTMVILPPEDELNKNIIDDIKKFAEKKYFPEIKFIGFEDSNYKFLQDFDHIDKVRFSTIPAGEQFKIISNKNFDLSIDMNHKFCPKCALLGLLCDVPKRVGFSDRYESPYYNLIYKGGSLNKFTEFMEGLKN
ncbi:MAG: hypothetical protein ACLFSQ_02115 [Candidatus Zixiibacteriota bacterium]